MVCINVFMYVCGSISGHNCSSWITLQIWMIWVKNGFSWRHCITQQSVFFIRFWWCPPETCRTRGCYDHTHQTVTVFVHVFSKHRCHLSVQTHSVTYMSHSEPIKATRIYKGVPYGIQVVTVHHCCANGQQSVQSVSPSGHVQFSIKQGW